MRRKRRIFQHSNTQGYPLRDHIDLHHPLVELADMIDWAEIDRVATEPFQPGPGRPILRPRLIAGLLYLQHAFNLSDEQIVAGWLENPYWQVFTGETHFWLGLHHHALLTMIAFTYLQHRRLTSALQAGEKTGTQYTRSATPAIITGSTPRPYRRAASHHLRSVS